MLAEQERPLHNDHYNQYAMGYNEYSHDNEEEEEEEIEYKPEINCQIENEMAELPSWLHNDSPVQIEEINKFLNENQQMLNKRIYKLVIKKMRDILNNKHNQDAIVRGKLNKTKSSTKRIRNAIHEDLLVIERMKANELRDKEYINLQSEELLRFKNMFEKQTEKKDQQFFPKESNPVDAERQKRVNELNEKQEQRETELISEVNDIKKEIINALKAKKQLVNRKLYSQEDLLDQLLLFKNDDLRREQSKKALKEILNTRVLVQAEEMKIAKLKAKIEKIRADNTLKCLQEQQELTQKFVDEARELLSLPKPDPEPLPESKIDCAPLYKVNVPSIEKYDFMATPFWPKSFIPNSKLFIAPQSSSLNALSRSLNKYNEDFKKKNIPKNTQANKKPEKEKAIPQKISEIMEDVSRILSSK